MINLKTLLSELTQKQKELKKDYLFNQSKMHSSNTVPSWTEMWKAYQNTSMDRNISDLRADRDLYHPMTPEIEKEDPNILRDIEDTQRHKYFELVNLYKQLNGERCWREIYLPKSLNPQTLEQLGVYWAIEENAAEAHWGHGRGMNTTCTYEGVIDLNIIDWPGTMFARMDYTLGDDENEIRFLKNSKIFVNHVIVFGDGVKDVHKFEIKDYRRL